MRVIRREAWVNDPSSGGRERVTYAVAAATEVRDVFSDGDDVFGVVRSKEERTIEHADGGVILRIDLTLVRLNSSDGLP